LSKKSSLHPKTTPHLSYDPPQSLAEPSFINTSILPMADKKNKTDAQQHYLGHRQRLKERFMEANENLADYEILELLLFFSNPRKDTKPLAKKLIQELGGLAQVLCGPLHKVEKIPGIGGTSLVLFRLVLELSRRLLRTEMRQEPLLNNIEVVVNYCRPTMAFLEIEQFRVLLLDKKNYLLKDYVQQTGTLDQTPLYSREVVKKILEYNAASLILVHNHPSGDPSPSKMDLVVTQQLQEHLNTIQVKLLDHLIIGALGYFSFREHQLL
jgi:DNA repair protein RadC